MTEENTTPVAEETKDKLKSQETPETKRNEKSEKRSRSRKPRRDRKPRDAKEFEEAILQIDRVTRVTKGGRQMRFRITVVIGDRNGQVGFGLGKSSEVILGIQKAVADAKKKLINVPIMEGTIPHEALGKFKASDVLLFPAPEGKGIIAGGAVRKILELAGIRDVLSKVHGSRNRVNIAHATFDALTSLATKPLKTSEETSPSETAPEEESTVKEKSSDTEPKAKSQTKKKETEK